MSLITDPRELDKLWRRNKNKQVFSPEEHEDHSHCESCNGCLTLIFGNTLHCNDCGEDRVVPDRKA